MHYKFSPGLMSRSQTARVLLLQLVGPGFLEGTSYKFQFLNQKGGDSCSSMRAVPK